MIADAISTMLPARRAMLGPDDDFWFLPIGSRSESGIVVTPENTLGVSAAFGCIRVLRESLASLPWKVYERTGEKSKKLADDHYLWDTLHDRPNSWQTPIEFKDMAVSHICLRGNFYCQIRNIGSKGMELWPMSPDRMDVIQLPSRELRYEYREQNKEPIQFSQEQIFHVRGMSLNGVKGVSVLEYARNSIGSTIAQTTHGASLFKNGGLPTFWISRPREARWTPTARKNFREEWRAIHAGADNAGQPPILGDGMELHELGMTNRDSQWLESRGFEAEEICRFFGVHPHMIGVRASAPLGSIEQQSLEFVLYTLGPLAVRFEQAANRDLLIDDERYFTKIVLDALLRADIRSRYEAHNISVQGGWGLINEVREMEDRNPIEGGDEPRFPLNMQPVGGGPDENEQGGQPGKGQPKQEQAEDDEEEESAFEKRKKRTIAEATSIARILLKDVAKRCADREIVSLSRRIALAKDDPEKWHEYLSEFYGKHLEYVCESVGPVCLTWLALTGLYVEPLSVAESAINAANVMFDTNNDLPQLLEQWRQDRTITLQGVMCKALLEHEYAI